MLDMEILAMIFDVLLIVAVLGLWMAWLKQNEQQGNIERKLAEAASELQEATKMLDQALDQISVLQTSPKPSPGTPETVVKTTDVRSKDNTSDEQNFGNDHAQLAQILRMQREGESPENIAQDLEIPLARVKLLLMLRKC